MIYRFEDVVGHEEIISEMRGALASGNVAHAYLLTGEEGMGKRTLATLFAAGLQCAGKAERPCGECASCKKLAGGNHPDIRFVTHEKAATIGVDEIRGQLVGDVGIRPYESDYKVYIVAEAEKMTVQAQNALLKTIEEPPEYAVILLLASATENLLPTVVSRCVRFDLRPTADERIQAYLTDFLQVPEAEAEVQTAFAKGNIGRARSLALSPDFAQMVSRALSLVKRSKTMSVAAMIEAVRDMASDKEHLRDYLDLFELWFRDVLMFKATRDTEGLVFADELGSIRERAQVSGYEGLEDILEALNNAKQRLKANVNIELVLELLFLTIQEN